MISPAEKLAMKPVPPCIRRGRAILVCHLRKLRNELGLSAKQVGEENGISTRTIELMERGLGPKLENALLLARFYGVAVEKIWSLPEKKKLVTKSQPT